MDHEAVPNFGRHFGPEHSRHGPLAMTAEIVHNQVNGCGFWVCQGQTDCYQGELKTRTIRCRECEMTTRFRLDGAEDIGGATAFVFVIPPGFSPRLRQRGGTNSCSVPT